MTVKTFDVGGIPVHLVTKRIKNINLRILANGQVRLSAPYRTPLFLLQRFLDEKREWIVHHHHRLQTRVEKAPLSFTSGERHSFLGQSYPLIVCDRAPYQNIQFFEDKLYCFCKGESTLEQRKTVLNAWYRKQLVSLLPELIDKWEKHIGVKAERYTIRLMKRRWGTCYSQSKHILFNLALIQKPIPCIEFVIVHELVHLLEASHNQRFYALMNQFMPDWREYHHQLNNKLAGIC